MTTMNQNKYWSKPWQYTRQVSWTSDQELPCFLNVKRSRKGTRLNTPEEFYRRPLSEQSFIKQIPVLPRAGCSDMEYVLYQQNAFRREMMLQEQMHYTQPHYTPSVTINIGTPLFNQNEMYKQSQRKYSYSTISINPTVISEEPHVTQQIVVPLGLYCCGQRDGCEHTLSKEQKNINLDIPEDKADERFVYVTQAPRISPMNSCWKFLTCKRKKRHGGEVYLPSTITRYHTRNGCVPPNCSKTSGGSIIYQEKNDSYLKKAHSRLSSIAESCMTISDYSSEEFVTSDQQHWQKTQPAKNENLVQPQTYTDIGRPLQNIGSFLSQEPVYRWICEPSPHSKKKNTLNNRNSREYICYRDF